MGAGLPAKNKKLALIDLMILHPELSAKDLGVELGLSKSRIAVIMGDPLFQLALDGRREKQAEKVSDLRAEIDTHIKDATVAAIRESKNILENKEAPIVVKQTSISQILAQGHAKAIERSAHMEIPVPPEMLRELLAVSQQMLTPIVPVKRLERIHEEDPDVVDVPAS